MSILFIPHNPLIPSRKLFSQTAGGLCCNVEGTPDLPTANTDM